MSDTNVIWRVVKKRRGAMDLLNICKATVTNSELLSEHMPVGNIRQIQLLKYHINICGALMP